MKNTFTYRHLGIYKRLYINISTCTSQAVVLELQAGRTLAVSRAVGIDANVRAPEAFLAFVKIYRVRFGKRAPANELLSQTHCLLRPQHYHPTIFLPLRIYSYIL